MASRPLSLLFLPLLLGSFAARAEAPLARLQSGSGETSVLGEGGILSDSGEPSSSYVRVRTGMTLRSGRSLSPTGGFAYNGSSAAHVGASVRVSLIKLLALRAELERESFGLELRNQQLSKGSLWRGQALLAAVYGDRGFWSEAHAGYGFAQLPFLGTAANPTFEAGARHALMFGARLGFALSDAVTMDIGASAPLSLAATSSRGTFSSVGASLDAWLNWTFARVGANGVGAALGYTLVSERYRAAEDPVSSQKLSRVSVGLNWMWGGSRGLAPAMLSRTEPPAPDRDEEPLDGSLPSGHGDDKAKVVVRVLDADTRQPLKGASVEVTGTEGALNQSVGVDGRASFDEVGAGALVARATLTGYQSGELQLTVKTGAAEEHELLLRKQATKRPTRKTGDLSLVIVDARTRKPLPAALVNIRGDEYFSGNQGDLVLVDLAAGATEVIVNAAGYRPMKETVRVAPGETTEFRIELQRAKR